MFYRYTGQRSQLIAEIGRFVDELQRHGQRIEVVDVFIQIVEKHILDPCLHFGRPQEGRLCQPGKQFHQGGAAVQREQAPRLLGELALPARLQRQPPQIIAIAHLVDHPEKVVRGTQAVLLPPTFIHELMEERVVHLVHHVQRGRLQTVPHEQLVHPGFPRQQRILYLGKFTALQAIVRRPLQQRIGDVVFHQLRHLEETQPAETEKIVVKGQQSIGAVVLLIRGDQFFAQGADHQPQIRGDVSPAVQVDAAVVFAVGVVWLFVVLVLVDPEVVVHVHAEEELRAVHSETQEGLLVVGNHVRSDEVVVLIEVGNKIVVLVQTGEHLGIPGQPVKAHGIRKAILIVVVLHQFDDAPALAFVVDLTGSRGDKGPGIVERVHVIGLAEDEERMGLLGQVDHPGRRTPLPADARRGSVDLLLHVRILPIAPAQIVFSV